MSQPSPAHRVPPALLMVDGETPGRLFELTRSVITIGRNPEHCEIVFNSPAISRRHARLNRVNDTYEIQDLDSRGGVHLNDQPLGKPALLRDGDTIRICDAFLVFRSAAVQVEDIPWDDSSIVRVRDATDMWSKRVTEGRDIQLRQKLTALVEISRNLGRTFDLKETLENILGTLFQVFPKAHRGFILVKEGDSLNMIPMAMKARKGEFGTFSTSRTIIRKVMQDGEAVLSHDVAHDARWNETESIQASKLRTLMVVPILDARQSAIGIIQMDSSDYTGAFVSEDLDVLAVVAGQVGGLIQNAGLHQQIVQQTREAGERQDARRVQRTFLPKQRPCVQGLAFWDCYEPALTVGGDYYGYFPIFAFPARDHSAPFASPTGIASPGSGTPVVPQTQLFKDAALARAFSDGPAAAPPASSSVSGLAPGSPSHLAVAVGDVSGKGLPAALVMAKLSAEARVCALGESNPVVVVERLNDLFHDDEMDGMFVTFLLAWFDLAAECVTLVRAGHNGAIVRRVDGRAEMVGEEQGGPPLGVVARRRYPATSFQLLPGEIMVLFTDGITEAKNARGEEFGIDRLIRAVRQAGPLVEHVGDAVMQAVRAHAAQREQSDDITLLCVGRVAVNDDPQHP